MTIGWAFFLIMSMYINKALLILFVGSCDKKTKHQSRSYWRLFVGHFFTFLCLLANSDIIPLGGVIEDKVKDKRVNKREK